MFLVRLFILTSFELSMIAGAAEWVSAVPVGSSLVHPFVRYSSHLINVK